MLLTLFSARCTEVTSVWCFWSAPGKIHDVAEDSAGDVSRQTENSTLYLYLCNIVDIFYTLVNISRTLNNKK